MARESAPATGRRAANRDKILSAAVRVFAEEGLEAHLERIAKEAGVGSGTLYRNFPTREVLIEAAYRNELVRLCDAAADLLAALAPREALRAWTGRFIDYATAKLGMADALRALVESGVNPYGQSHEMMMAALTSLLPPASKPAPSAPTWRHRHVRRPHRHRPHLGKAGAAKQAERLLDLDLDGLSTDRR